VSHVILSKECQLSRTRTVHDARACCRARVPVSVRIHNSDTLAQEDVVAGRNSKSATTLC
jgi:hypothetical protein